MERRLAAILAADAVGYSKQMGVNEEAAFSALSARRTIIDSTIEKHGGRIFATAGDSVVAEYRSTVEAVRSAVEIQEQILELNQGLAESDETAVFARGFLDPRGDLVDCGLPVEPDWSDLGETDTDCVVLHDEDPGAEAHAPFSVFLFRISGFW